MTKYSLTITPLKVIETNDDKRIYMFSAGLFDGGVVVYVRVNDVGDANTILTKEGTTVIALTIPCGRPVYAWTNTGTAELCTERVN